MQLTDKDVSAMNDVISICKDAQEGFRGAADSVENSSLKTLFEEYSTQRATFARELESALALVRKAAAGDGLSTDQGRGLVDVIARYTQTFLLLQRRESIRAQPLD